MNKYLRKRKTVHVVFKYLSRSIQAEQPLPLLPPPFSQSSETETTFHYCCRLKSGFKLVWMESISPLIGNLLYSGAAVDWTDTNHFCQKLVLTVQEESNRR
jgi:hypothetical protein